MLVLPDPLLLLVHSYINTAGDPSEEDCAIDVGRQCSHLIVAHNDEWEPVMHWTGVGTS